MKAKNNVNYKKHVYVEGEKIANSLKFLLEN